MRHTTRTGSVVAMWPTQTEAGKRPLQRLGSLASISRCAQHCPQTAAILERPVVNTRTVGQGLGTHRHTSSTAMQPVHSSTIHSAHPPAQSLVQSQSAQLSRPSFSHSRCLASPSHPPLSLLPSRPFFHSFLVPPPIPSTTSSDVRSVRLSSVEWPVRPAGCDCYRRLSSGCGGCEMG